VSYFSVHALPLLQGWISDQNFTVIKGLEKESEKIFYYTMKLSLENLIFLSETDKRNMINVVSNRNRQKNVENIVLQVYQLEGI